MDRQTLALVIQEGTRLVTTLLRNKTLLFSQQQPEETQDMAIEEAPVIIETTSLKATAIATGCIPCSIGHLGTCSGLLNEAMRFAHKDGIQSEEVIDRVNMCMDELNALERVDLRPEMIHGLPDWEKSLADDALGLSRSLRHDLEALSDVPALEAIAAKTQTKRQEIGKAWFKERITRMTPGQRKNVEEELTRRAEEREKGETSAEDGQGGFLVLRGSARRKAK